jgi:hypothetical protein
VGLEWIGIWETTVSFSLTLDVEFISRARNGQGGLLQKSLEIYTHERVRCKERGDNMQTDDKQWNNEYGTKHDWKR